MLRLSSVPPRRLNVIASGMTSGKQRQNAVSSISTSFSSSDYDNVGTRQVSISSSCVHNDLVPAIEQLRFDDEMDDVFACIPSERLEYEPFSSSVGGSSRASILQDHKMGNADNHRVGTQNWPFQILSGASYGQWTGSGIYFDDDLPLHSALHNSKMLVNRGVTSTKRQYTTSASSSTTDSKRREYHYISESDEMPISEHLPRLQSPPRKKSIPRSKRADNFTEGAWAKSLQHLPKFNQANKSSERTLTAVEVERRRREYNLQPYSYLRPAGTIGSMRKTAEEIADEMTKLGAQAATSSESEIRLSTHRVAQCHILSNEVEINEQLKVIGEKEVLSFDMEWPFSRSGPGKTSVIQIASAAKVFVLQVGDMEKLPQELIRIICDSTIIKCGVAIQADATKLQKDFGVKATMANKVELSKLAKLVDKKRWQERKFLISLRDLCSIYLGRRLNKDAAVRQGPWAISDLSPSQREYAASDAYVGLEILYSLAKMASVSDSPELFQQEQVRTVMVKAQMGTNIVRKGDGEMSTSTVYEGGTLTTEEPAMPAGLFGTFKMVGSNLLSKMFSNQDVVQKEEKPASVAKEQESLGTARDDWIEERSSTTSLSTYTPSIRRIRSFQPPSKINKDESVVQQEEDIDPNTKHLIQRLWRKGLSGSHIKLRLKIKSADVYSCILWSLAEFKIRLNSEEQKRLVRSFNTIMYSSPVEFQGYLASQSIFFEGKSGHWLAK